MAMPEGSHDELLTSLIQDIKCYSGHDPLRPWLRGIRKMHELLSPSVINDKLPRFLQKCVQTFESECRYCNDPRYIRVWIQLMDYVDDPKALLRKMEKQKIGLKTTAYYTAYALYYEKKKKFEDAERAFHLGIQNLAEPATELQTAYEQFLCRMETCKKRKAKGAFPITRRSSKSTFHKGDSSTKEGSEGFSKAKDPSDMKSDMATVSFSSRFEDGKGAKINSILMRTKPISASSDETVVVKFVGSAIVGKSVAEDACHHGLVDPTINMKEAINAISSMFREPLETESMVNRRSNQNKPKKTCESNELEVYVDEDVAREANLDMQRIREGNQNENKFKNPNSSEADLEPHQSFVGGFEIYIDGKDDIDDGKNSLVHENSGLQKDDTVIHRFIGSTVLSEPKVENACHHGLVDPTINMKEAMDDINSMFGKPLDNVKVNKPKKQLKVQEQVSFSILADNELKEAPKGKFADDCPVDQGFMILADDEPEENSKPLLDVKQSVHEFYIMPDNVNNAKDDSSVKVRGIYCESPDKDGLFEPTSFTKEAMADINEMFGRSIDF